MHKLKFMPWQLERGDFTLIIFEMIICEIQEINCNCFSDLYTEIIRLSSYTGGCIMQYDI